jgi:hypothetical protein
MKIEIDKDVAAVINFMEDNIPADRLVAVAKASLLLGTALWDRYVAVPPYEPLVRRSPRELNITSDYVPPQQ